MKLERFAGNPILSAHPGHPWEDLAVFNPAAWYDEEKKEVLLLYRAAESGPEYKCFFGLARSKDGRHFERVLDQPALDVSGEGFDGATILCHLCLPALPFRTVLDSWSAPEVYGARLPAGLSALLAHERHPDGPGHDQGL
ncbi:MAG: hypothetical protein NTW03_07650 [Verrucomicrobia bacterium]|nr:hypothetical protein [Verrucomicrobiota bacterium]